MLSTVKKLIDFIQGLDTKEFLQYSAIFWIGLSSIMGILVYINYNRVNKYNTALKRINRERSKTKEILTDSKIISQQKAKVEEILEQEKNFFIGQAYNNILKELKLLSYQPELPTQQEGQKTGNKTEIILDSHLDGITMEQLTKLLLKTAENQRLYPKELNIKKMPNAKTIDIDFRIATLESA